ncbi:AraC family transcriptional regulator [Paenibacillus hemerocallicola]|nr:AraC family transcriptional regulator [Paenibacillus hemerocallicola]
MSYHSDNSLSYESLKITANIGDLRLELLLDASFGPDPFNVWPKNHNHYAFEVHCFLSGRGSCIVDTDEIPVQSGDVLIFGPEVYHRFKEAPSHPIRRYIVQFNYTRATGSGRRGLDPETRDIAATLEAIRHYRFQDDGTIAGLLHGLKKELDTASLGRYSCIQSLFVLLILHLVRSVKLETYPYQLPNKQKDDMRTRIIDMFFHDRQPIGSLEELAAQLNLSPRQTNRVLNKYYNTSFKQKLFDTRLEIAKDLLINSDQTVLQIAEEVGYSGANNFNDMFVKKTGVTPAKFRKLHRPDP